jgi:hypothetical protein
MAFQQIDIIPSHKIDRNKWNECITGAANGTIYGEAFYLDIMSANWDGIVLNDYEAVMPLTWKKKYGFYYLYQPAFTNHTAIFGNTISDEIVNTFLSAIPGHFKYWDIDFKEDSVNPGNIFLSNLHFTKRSNFFLSLNREYSTINREYKRLAHRMIRKANESGIKIIKDCDPGEVVNFYKLHYGHLHQKITGSDYAKLTEALTIASKNEKAAMYTATTPAGKIIAVYGILKDKNFIYSLIGGSDEAGKEAGAFYLLTDAAINDHAGTRRTFRFEGSDKKGIALFNSQFGPVPVEYYHVKYNGLPWPVKLLK